MIRILVVLCALQGISPLSNVQVTVPTFHKASSPLKVNCDYSIDPDEADQVVLTWYFNDSPIPIYQWVPGLEMGPQVIHKLFKDNLDLHYEEDSEELKKHAALHITNPDQRFSGIYKCRVSTFTEEFTAEERVSIYVPPAKVSINSKNGVISCVVKGVFPPPSVILSWTSNGTVFSSEEAEVTADAVNSKTVDVLVNGTVDESFLEAHDMVICEVSIEGTDYNERIEQTILNTDEKDDYPCKSAKCVKHPKIEDYETFEAAEAVENNVVTGTGINTLSGEAAKYVESASCWWRLNVLLLITVFFSALF